MLPDRCRKHVEPGVKHKDGVESFPIVILKWWRVAFKHCHGTCTVARSRLLLAFSSQAQPVSLLRLSVSAMAAVVEASARFLPWTLHVEVAISKVLSVQIESWKHGLQCSLVMICIIFVGNSVLVPVRYCWTGRSRLHHRLGQRCHSSTAGATSGFRPFQVPGLQKNWGWRTGTIKQIKDLTSHVKLYC